MEWLTPNSQYGKNHKRESMEDKREMAIARLITGFLAWTISSLAWWSAIPTLALAAGRPTDLALWKCFILSLVPGIGQLGVAAWLLSWLVG